MLQKITHCIFDLDGLLLDTETIYTRATQTILDRYTNGAEFTNDVKNKIMGQLFTTGADIVIKAYNLPLCVQKYISIFHEISDSLITDCKLMPGAKELVQHILNQGIPVGIATGSCLSSYKLKVTNHKDLFEPFKFVVTGDDVKLGKPDPEIFVKSISLFESADPKSVLILEDSLNGAIAAVNSGAYCAWVVDERVISKPYHLPEHIKNTNRIQIFNSLTDIDLNEYGIAPLNS